jgi:hypothetical protein
MMATWVRMMFHSIADKDRKLLQFCAGEVPRFVTALEPASPFCAGICIGHLLVAQQQPSTRGAGIFCRLTDVWLATGHFRRCTTIRRCRRKHVLFKDVLETRFHFAE